ncbi:MAG: hypothetical protein KAS12_01510 [Candidatus Aenigmarchaeota archaeon]|nr:hypothetical protein [Candidatus Aenigmarchaeota archaeon]
MVPILRNSKSNAVKVNTVGLRSYDFTIKRKIEKKILKSAARHIWDDDVIYRARNGRENNVLFLDSHDLLTAKHFHRVFPKKNLTIIEKSPTVAKIMNKRGYDAIVAPIEEMAGSLMKLKNYPLVYLDFSCTIIGALNDNSAPLTAIQEILKNTSLNKIVIATTFSMRGNPKLSLTDQKTMPDEIYFNYLRPCFRSAQFTGKVQYMKYSRNVDAETMVVFISELHRDTTINPDDIDYIIHRYPDGFKFAGYSEWLAN